MNKNLSIYDVNLVIIVGTTIVILLAYFIILFFFNYKRKYNEHAQEVIKIKNEFAQTLLQTQLEIQEQTLQHISKELHDNLGQVASLIKINLTTLQLQNTEKAQEKIENTKELTRQLIGDIKSLSVSLGSDRITQYGLAKALEIEVEHLNKTGQFTASFVEETERVIIDESKAIIIYRMVQEALNNIIKHSNAKQIMVLLKTSENLFILEVSDDGIGFLSEEKKNKGAGLQNLQSRAKLINAALIISSIPGNGTIVTIKLPL